jgi:Zn-dependent M28 family amino/carboxypeptidase
MKEGATQARCKIVGGMVPATSQNIVIDLAGTDLADEILYVGAHHDTQAASPGADDNASGVVGSLEIARLLHGRPRRRTIRIISFGAEEQLVRRIVGLRADASPRSVGAGTVDVQPRLVRVPTGVAAVARQRPSDFEASFRPHFRAANLYYQTVTSVVPYADHFPFAAAGFPRCSTTA